MTYSIIDSDRAILGLVARRPRKIGSLEAAGVSRRAIRQLLVSGLLESQNLPGSENVGDDLHVGLSVLGEAEIFANPAAVPQPL